MESLSKLVL